MPSNPEFIPLCAPQLGGNDEKYVTQCLRSTWVSTVGSIDPEYDFLTRFEEMTARYVGAPHAVAACSGTAALHLALLALGVQPEDEVITSALTFIAPVNAIRYVQAHPVLIDAEPQTLQMDTDACIRLLKTTTPGPNGRINPSTGRRIGAVLPVHILGHAADLSQLAPLCRELNVPLLEDATEALGTRAHGSMCGTIGDAGCYSFNGNKLITTGGGGMLVSHNPQVAQRARHLSTQAKRDPIEFVHDEVGYNYRLTNLQAALGVSQMEQIDHFIHAKRRIAQRYTEALSNCPGIRTPVTPHWQQPNCWLYTIQVDPAKFGCDSRTLMRALAAERIQSRPLWQPLHKSPAHPQLHSFHCPNAHHLAQTSLSLPCSTGLTDAQQNRVLSVIRSAAG
jgi:perosamine synthetase